jgi:hypothetical protein
MSLVMMYLLQDKLVKADMKELYFGEMATRNF